MNKYTYREKIEDKNVGIEPLVSRSVLDDGRVRGVRPRVLHQRAFAVLLPKNSDLKNHNYMF